MSATRSQAGTHAVERGDAKRAAVAVGNGLVHVGDGLRVETGPDAFSPHFVDKQSMYLLSFRRF
jgi:hypothetical protein